MHRNTLVELEDHARDVLKSISEEFRARVPLFDLDKYLRAAERKARKQIVELIPSHSVLLRLSCTVMLLLARYIARGKGDMQRGAYAGIQSRATNDLLCIRRLLEGGFEESARPITRCYFESLDLGLACLGDPSFADGYNSDEDPEAFWRDHIGYGRIYRYLAHTLKLAGIDQESIDEKIERRRRQKTFLSNSVHCDATSSFRSWAPSPLGYPDMVSLALHGVANVHTANHIASVVIETYEYCASVMKLVAADVASGVLNRTGAKRERAAYAVHFFALQELLQNHRFQDGAEVLAPDYAIPSEY